MRLEQILATSNKVIRSFGSKNALELQDEQGTAAQD